MPYIIAEGTKRNSQICRARKRQAILDAGGEIRHGFH
jgi:hypothetical protein